MECIFASIRKLELLELVQGGPLINYKWSDIFGPELNGQKSISFFPWFVHPYKNVSKNRDKKNQNGWLIIYNGKPYEQIDDLAENPHDFGSYGPQLMSLVDCWAHPNGLCLRRWIVSNRPTPRSGAGHVLKDDDTNGGGVLKDVGT